MTRKTSEGTKRGSLASAEPPTLLPEVEGTEEDSAGGLTEFPSVKLLRAAQLLQNAQQIEWLATCKRLCELRLPSEVFSLIPKDVWKLAPWGTKVVILRAPKHRKEGAIIRPDTHLRPNHHGWIILAGPEVTFRDTPDQVVRGKTCPYYDLRMKPDYWPLLLVGEMVQFNPAAAGRHLGAVRGGKIDPDDLLITSIADVWGPIPAPDVEDWSTELS
jgi:hypothetical protein